MKTLRIALNVVDGTPEGPGYSDLRFRPGSTVWLDIRYVGEAEVPLRALTSLIADGLEALTSNAAPSIGDLFPAEV